MKRIIAAAAFVVALLPGIASAHDKLTVLLDWFVNPDHAPLVVAKHAGIFDRHELLVDLIAPADPNDPPKLVAAGKADVAISYQPQLHVQVAQGLPLRRFGTLVATPLNSLVVLRDGPIKSVADLKGRKIGYSVGGFEDALLKSMLEQYGLKLADVTLINVNFSLSPSIFSGQVDATIGAFRNFELNQMDIAGKPGRAFYPEDYGVPLYDELVLVAHKNKLNDDRLKRLLDALEEAVAYMHNEPQKSWQAFIKENKSLDDELNRRAWGATVPRFAQSPRALDSRRYSRFADYLVKQGLIPKALPVADYAVELH
ncbi:ABC transporter substrate-binding protein [Ferrovibrio sp.]|uniref:ABC transporter substrate-binding protein n=1 Tax=Ferrovibrio sp. TaxID=1917215 RepID=UPI000CC89CCF|nr:ABC transporter substrate-binding protein [Ferrovibrio sp.]PJI44440.1 MAG: ABC transporter ATP-binding protein [Ferrovibrio sp.]